MLTSQATRTGTVFRHSTLPPLPAACHSSRIPHANRVNNLYRTEIAHALPSISYSAPRSGGEFRQRTSGRCCATGAEVFSSFESVGDAEHVVVNFYHLVDIPEPQQLVERHKSWVASKNVDVRGRIYFSSQGVNAQFGGTKSDAQAYTEYVQSQDRFQSLRYSVWPATGQMFPKLRLKYKPNLISLAGGMEGVPVTDPSSRATALEPEDWRKMIVEAKAGKAIVLDVRNDYEWDAGHFQGAERPQEEEFAETPVGGDDNDVPGYLKGADPDTPVMMYCTGGIRCDVYSAFLRKKGFNKLYTLEGGVQNYLLKAGPEHWNGSLYVFDGRMAIPPTVGTAIHKGPEAVQNEPLPAAAPCQVCGRPDAQLPHMNCANMDCNELYIACASCKTKYAGCCCKECMSAPRLLRPMKPEGGHYGAWGNYADNGDGELISRGRKREGRVARMAKRRAAMREKRSLKHEAEIELRKQLKEATARLLSSQSQNKEPLSEKQRKIQELRAKLQACTQSEAVQSH